VEHSLACPEITDLSAPHSCLSFDHRVHFLEFLFCFNIFSAGFTMKIMDDFSGLFVSTNFNQPPLITGGGPRQKKNVSNHGSNILDYWVGIESQWAADLRGQARTWFVSQPDQKISQANGLEYQGVTAMRRPSWWTDYHTQPIYSISEIQEG